MTLLRGIAGLGKLTFHVIIYNGISDVIITCFLCNLLWPMKIFVNVKSYMSCCAVSLHQIDLISNFN